LSESRSGNFRRAKAPVVSEDSSKSASRVRFFAVSFATPSAKGSSSRF
jgi:hypothetical protein